MLTGGFGWAFAVVMDAVPTDENVRRALDELANLLRAAALNATELRRDLGARVETAVALLPTAGATIQ